MKKEATSFRACVVHTELMDNSPYYAGWPKRSKSLICSTSVVRAGDYGDPYAIIPVDGTKIAVCPDEDIWDTPVVLPGIGKISFGFIPGESEDIGLAPNYQRMIKTINGSDFKEEVLDPLRLTAKEYIDQLHKGMSPAATGMRLMTINEFSNQRLNNREVWIGRPVVAIDIDWWDDIKQEIALIEND